MIHTGAAPILAPFDLQRNFPVPITGALWHCNYFLVAPKLETIRYIISLHFIQDQWVEWVIIQPSDNLYFP